MIEKIIADVNDERLDKFLSLKFDITRNKIQKMIEEENILVNSKKTKSSYKVQVNDTIEVNFIDEIKESDIKPQDLNIFSYYDDKYISVVEKNAGITTHISKGHYDNTLVNGLMYKFKNLSTINGEYRPGIVHRLDKNTSGLLIVAKNDEAHYKLSEMFKNHQLDKKYLAIVKGKLKNKTGIIDNYIGRDKKDRKKMAVLSENENGVKRAISIYRVIKENENFSLVEIEIKTGRTHQIRVHMKFLNNPILGDETYSRNTLGYERQMLHSYYLKFNHPITNEILEIRSKLPKDFKEALIKTKLGDIDEYEI